MKIKIYMDEANTGAHRIENLVNTWLEEEGVEIKDAHTAVCTMTDPLGRSTWPHLTLTIFYEEIAATQRPTVLA
ncbi:MAG TPA: hypothetical protein VNH44_18015, partial [Micropepsaceae bacterium]|nr:hypothetical protein [Micropepsaceae bacterium]